MDIHYVLNIIILIISSFFYLLIFNLISKFKIKDIIYLFILWSILLLIFNSFLYSIWKNLSVNLYFFSLDIRWNNIFENFESYYKLFIKNLWTSNWFLWALTLLILPWILEELWKFLIFVKFYKDKITSISDSLIGIWIIALWFAFFENIFYLLLSFQTFENGEKSLGFVYQLNITRWIISTWSHIFFSMIIWFFYGNARFAWFNIIDEWWISKLNNILIFIRKINFFHINTISKIYSYKLIITGLFFAIISHILYNFLLSKWYIILSICILFFWATYFYFFIISQKKTYFNYMKLEEKIEYLKKSKDIKHKRILLFGNKK